MFRESRCQDMSWALVAFCICIGVELNGPSLASSFCTLFRLRSSARRAKCFDGTHGHEYASRRTPGRPPNTCTSCFRCSRCCLSSLAWLVSNVRYQSYVLRPAVACLGRRVFTQYADEVILIQEKGDNSLRMLCRYVHGASKPASGRTITSTRHQRCTLDKAFPSSIQA